MVQTNSRQRQGRIPGPWRGGGGAGSALRVGAGVPPRLDGAVVAAPGHGGAAPQARLSCIIIIRGNKENRKKKEKK